MQSNRFNSELLLQDLLEWVAHESPTYDAQAVNGMVDRVESALKELNARLERVPGKLGFADALIARFGAVGKPGILVLGHVDTVHPIGTIDGPLPIRREDDRVYGPGILDMKSGLFLAVAALRELQRTGRKPQLPITFLIIPDEEVGSPSTRELIEETAAEQRYVLVPEPAREGKLVTGRHAFLRYTITVHGTPAHAGADNVRGASAISAMAKLVTRLEQQSDFERGLTYSVGIIKGGTFVNVVPNRCEAQVLCVAPDPTAIAEVRRTMRDLEGQQGNIAVDVEPGAVRPLFDPSEQGLALFDRAAQFAEQIGVRLEHGKFGGGSDGNFTGALGIATLDGLGPTGAGPHTHQEHIVVSSLAERAHILAGLIETLE